MSNRTGAGHGPKGQCRASKQVAEKEEKKPARRKWVVPHRGRENGQMKSQDKSRKWMWWFLGIVAALQLYFVRELVAAFALFALGFAVIGSLFAGIYLLQKAWQSAVVRVAESSHPAVEAARRGVYAVEDFARRPLRRPGSAAAR
jgi:hypothetical protein